MSVRDDQNVWGDPTPPAGHGELLAGLWRATETERLAHALLFTGARGIGKFTAARWFVRGMFCQRRIAGETPGPCGGCPPCKRLAAGSHPDVFVIEPDLADSEFLLLDRFVPRDGGGENAQEFLRLRPVEGGWRVVLVREMERTQGPVQNALLKMLEEPGENVLWLLETSRPAALLPTIHSRCVRVNLTAPSRDEARAVIERHGVPAAEAPALARWSGGAPGEALAMHARGAVALRALLAGVLAGRERAFGRAPAAQRLWTLEGRFQGKTARGVERDRARFALDLALAVVRDLARADAGAASEGLAHGDLAADLVPLVGGAARARRMVEALLEARRDIDRNVNPVAVLDLALLALEPGPTAKAGVR